MSNTGLTSTEPLASWLARVDEMEEPARSNQLRQAALVVRDAALSRKNLAAAGTLVRCVDGIVFAAEGEGEGAQEEPAEATVVFGRLLFFVLTRRAIGSAGEWPQRRAECGLAPPAIAVLDALFCSPSPSALDEVDLCPAELYARPEPVSVPAAADAALVAPVPVAASRSHSCPVIEAARASTPAFGGGGCGPSASSSPLRMRGLRLLGLIVVLATATAAAVTVAEQWQEQCEARVSFHRRQVGGLATELRSVKAENSALQEQLQRAAGQLRQARLETEKMAELLRDRSMLVRDVEVLRQRAIAGDARAADANNELAAARIQMEAMVKKLQSNAPCFQIVAELERQMAVLRSQVDFGKILKQVRKQTGRVVGSMSHLMRSHLPDAQSLAASYDALTRRIEGIAAMWSGGEHQHHEDNSSGCRCEAEQGRIRGLQGDYDACMNELFRLRNRQVLRDNGQCHA